MFVDGPGAFRWACLLTAVSYRHDGSKGRLQFLTVSDVRLAGDTTACWRSKKPVGCLILNLWFFLKTLPRGRPIHLRFMCSFLY